MSQVYRINLTGDAKLLYYEERMLCSNAAEFNIPFTVIRDESGEYINYLCDGYVPFDRYNFNMLGNVFTVLQTTIRYYMKAKKYLLNPFRFFSDTERILISSSSGAAIPLFGKELNNTGFEENELNLLVPIINELSMLRDVMCAKDAMEKIYKKVRDSNPGLKDILKIVLAEEREWSIILPASFAKS